MSSIQWTSLVVPNGTTIQSPLSTTVDCRLRHIAGFAVHQPTGNIFKVGIQIVVDGAGRILPQTGSQTDEWILGDGLNIVIPCSIWLAGRGGTYPYVVNAYNSDAASHNVAVGVIVDDQLTVSEWLARFWNYLQKFRQNSPEPDPPANPTPHPLRKV